MHDFPPSKLLMAGFFISFKFENPRNPNLTLMIPWGHIYKKPAMNNVKLFKDQHMSYVDLKNHQNQREKTHIPAIP